MRKRIINSIIILFVLLLIGGGAFFLLPKVREETAGSNSDSNSVNFLLWIINLLL